MASVFLVALGEGESICFDSPSMRLHVHFEHNCAYNGTQSVKLRLK